MAQTEVQRMCHFCHGTGASPNVPGPITCDQCGGTGWVEEHRIDLSDITDALADIKDKVKDIKDKVKDIWEKINE